MPPLWKLGYEVGAVEAAEGVWREDLGARRAIVLHDGRGNVRHPPVGVMGTGLMVVVVRVLGWLNPFAWFWRAG